MGLNTPILHHSNCFDLSSDSFPLVVQIVDNDVVAHLVGRGVKHAPGVEPRQLIDEPLPVEIRAEHKRVDLDAALGAAFHFLQRLMNDTAVQQRRAPTAVQPAAAIERCGRRFAVGNENDLAIGAAIRAE